MRYLLLSLLIMSFSTFAIESNSKLESTSVNCFESVGKQNLSHSRKRNFPTSNYVNCLDKSKNIAKEKKVTTPDRQVNIGAAVLLNPVGAAYWLINKAINTGVDKVINK